MKFKLDDSITNRNVEYAIKYLFDSDNISHQAIIIYQLNKLINNSDILLSLRKFIFKNSNKIKQYPNSLDTCGTGGDGLKTLNISTTVAILLSSVEIPIAKHGNRAASSLSGSSDIISELNISSEKDSKKIINKISNDITIAKKITDKPIIRKDFIINETQVFETKEFGADALLLIAKILSKSNIKKLHNLAIDIGLDVLIEIENITEARKIEGIDAKLIGINNRNLKEQKIDINKSIKLSKILKNKIIISESGVTVSNVKKIKKESGISSFLIGGSILKNDNKIKYINRLYEA